MWEALAHAGSALHFMHHHGVAHLDVKPSNMYVSMSGLIKLGDFGHAAVSLAPAHRVRCTVTKRSCKHRRPR